MRGGLTFLIRLICSIVLIVGVVPTWASEAVCVMPHRDPVPMAMCGMPCCAQRKTAMSHCTATVALPHPSCCSGSQAHSAQRVKPPVSKVPAGCKCETRITASVSHGQGVKTSGPIAHQVPVAIPTEPSPLVTIWAEAVVEPGIVGADSGPPPDPAIHEHPGRAPPLR